MADGNERNPNRNDETGQYSAGYTPDDALNALRELGGTAGTADVGEQMGCARRTAYNKLKELYESDRIDSQEVGSSRLWILIEDSEDST
ncbi:ArsR family transcriptional regulator [halophilic archaeon]|nr:ArsR family transcriptional regulator [halophilic archaeon]